MQKKLAFKISIFFMICMLSLSVFPAYINAEQESVSFIWEENIDGTVSIKGVETDFTGTYLEIPESINGKTVTAVANYAFYGN